MDGRTWRPLSPHLSIYRFTVLMAVSIMHRVTGVALCAGVLLFACWLLALALGPDAYRMFGCFVHSWVGLSLLFGLSWCFLHHLLGGLRHLVWDMVCCLDLKSARSLAWLGVFLSPVLTVAFWIMGYHYHHGL